MVGLSWAVQEKGQWWVAVGWGGARQGEMRLAAGRGRESPCEPHPDAHAADPPPCLNSKPPIRQHMARTLTAPTIKVLTLTSELRRRASLR